MGFFSRRKTAFTRDHAGCFPVGHLCGWAGPSGFGSRATACEVVDAAGGARGALAGRVVVVTGGNTGIGYETALALAMGGARVVLACRDAAAGDAAARAMTAEVEASRDVALEGEEATPPDVRAEVLDLASFASTRAFAARLVTRKISVHVLIHNAGIMPSPFALTENGHEHAFHVNALGPFLLTRLLLRSTLRFARGTTRTDPCRVVFVTSAVHRFSYPERVRFERLSGDAARVKYDPVKSYAQSKLCQIVLAREFHARYRASRRARDAHVAFFAVHPGAVITEGSERARLESSGRRGAILHVVGRPFVKARSYLHWSPYDRVRVVNADP